MFEWSVSCHESLQSTQETLKAYPSDDLKEGLVIQALEQTAGRGRGGNSWSSPKGNLYLSLVLKPDVATSRLGELAFVIAVGAGAALQELTNERFQLKWPNDVLYESRKLAGILIETDGAGHAFCGIGLNVDAPPEKAASVNAITGKAQDLAAVRDAILSHIKDIYILWNEKGFASVREAWLNDAYGLNQPMTARLPSGNKSGIFKGLDDNGALLLEVNGNTETIHAASVYFY